ncbi:hypothetical protein Cantr_02014 [Candida viswanathii]|uniref:Uncharacterized protein n=1 Tax=Candida viswanathii TaxID=5486 RepID=A0A367YKE1_9ASCO|nr:hypothetical protein Cantr_02014 [Candida viswanathii]
MTSVVYPPQRELSITPSIVAESVSTSSIHLHRRNSSNPFEVIYDEITGQRPTATHTRTNSQLWHNPHNYEEISKNIHHRTPSAAIPTTPLTPPILTILESQSGGGGTSATRSGSIVSRLATVRNRKRIIGRNKTVKKKDIAEHKPMAFPIRRKSSLKYKSLNNTSSKFGTKKQMLEFMKNTNYYELVHNLIPASFRLYRHTRILRPRPKLTYEAFGMAEPVTPLAVSVREYDMYDKYRGLIFDGKYRVEELDAVVLSDERLNRRLLFEILLRRTLAAKMDYRIRAAFLKSVYEGDDHMLEPIRRSTETISTF